MERAGRPSSKRLREDQQRFRLWLEDQRLEIRDPRQPYPRFGPGEAACLGLAQEEHHVLLINEAAAYREANRIGLRTITVPEILVRLAWRGFVANAKAEAMLAALSHTTNHELLAVARQAILRGKTNHDNDQVDPAE